ncbi:hypothetical protein [Cellulomonas sp. Y8]|uniref:hypothetical protein n=1 Tax=Cellulomonas sp. Y8 TaxID=2591145 RepID=UPI003D727527
MSTSQPHPPVVPAPAVVGLVLATTVLSLLGAAAGHALAAVPAPGTSVEVAEVRTACSVVDPVTEQRYTYVVRWAVHHDGHAEALDERPAADVPEHAVWACGTDVPRALGLTR